MTTTVWASRSERRPEFSESDSDWELVGDLDESRENEFWKVIQGHLGLRASQSRRTVRFYADLSTESAFYRDLLTRHPRLAHSIGVTEPAEHFWLALRWAGPPARILLAANQATLAALERRQPELHPGRYATAVAAVGMQLPAGDSGFFA